MFLNFITGFRYQVFVRSQSETRIRSDIISRVQNRADVRNTIQDSESGYILRLEFVPEMDSGHWIEICIRFRARASTRKT